MVQISQVVKHCLTYIIKGYQLTKSYWRAPCCRYEPSCSNYALDALATHPLAYGLWLILCRIGRCHPWGKHGYDPVPPTIKQNEKL